MTISPSGLNRSKKIYCLLRGGQQTGVYVFWWLWHLFFLSSDDLVLMCPNKLNLMCNFFIKVGAHACRKKANCVFLTYVKLLP